MQSHVAKHHYTLDDSQHAAVLALQRLYQDLLGLERMDASLIRLLARRRAVPGLYLWGGVGRGKSFLMDSFFACAPGRRKRRIHFHRFMQEVHHELKRLQGQTDPVTVVARRVARDTRLLCLDEFHVTDIGDAMLMRRFLEGLFAEGVVLVTTSNQHPDELYRHGLQRSQFLPAIELLKKQLQVVNVDSGTDYRLRTLERVEIFHAPLDQAAERNLAGAFDAIARGEGEVDRTLDIEGRVVRARKIAEGVAWFDFAELCAGPRGKDDYIELSRNYHTVLLSGIPQIPADHKDWARRLTWLVDEFYDRRVKLICSAAVAADKLYPAGAGTEFERTRSRLQEMQSRQYLAQAHLP
ncbi:MAG TPA: cell division protein ZapE [Burkholderiales bacterium]|nr:cell division protein ZapE [Burkholderiales bacterium]